ncbi:MAG: hypothetical protein M3R38_03790 [Actinomycetota bacterium]|nr:hypothetical protein [Actinomycetota bacterium]
MTERRRPANTPRDLEPHPESGTFPPCEFKGGENDPCGNDAAVHYGLSYLCEHHADATLANHEADDVRLAIDFCRRYLWAVRQWDLERLEHAIDGALSEYREDLERLQKRERAALERAVVGGE